MITLPCQLEQRNPFLNEALDPFRAPEFALSSGHAAFNLWFERSHQKFIEDRLRPFDRNAGAFLQGQAGFPGPRWKRRLAPFSIGLRPFVQFLCRMLPPERVTSSLSPDQDFLPLPTIASVSPFKRPGPMRLIRGRNPTVCEDVGTKRRPGNEGKKKPPALLTAPAASVLRRTT